MAENIITKICTVCKQTFPLSNFHKSPSYLYGHMAQCKACVLEYQRKRRGNKKKLTTMERFYSRIKSMNPGECWEWIGYIHSCGYAYFSVGYKHIYAHRFSYQTFKGEIPDGMFVCHTCDNPPCVNPEHLWLGTPKENTQDMVRKNRSVKGEKQHKAKLTNQAVIEIRQRFTEGERIIDLSRQYKVSPNTISYVVYRKTWTHI